MFPAPMILQLPVIIDMEKGQVKVCDYQAT